MLVGVGEIRLLDALHDLLALRFLRVARLQLLDVAFDVVLAPLRVCMQRGVRDGLFARAARLVLLRRGSPL
jgi:hypothetical protein